MDLPCIPWQNHIRQKWNSLDPDLKKAFTSLPETDDVFLFGLTQTTQEDVDVLLAVSRDYPVQKDSEQAARCRERGNTSFKARDYTTAALHYSQGVCLAPRTSEQISLCYANRSAALHRLGRCQDSLDDIGRALEHGYPPPLHPKLQARRAQCLHQLCVEETGPPRLSKPAAWDQKEPESPNTEPPFGLSPGVTVRFSPEKGRHLVATEIIAAGEVILKDVPYSCVLIPGTQGLQGRSDRDGERDGCFGTEDGHCHRCLGATLSAVPCQGCSYSRYCSVGCRQQSWEEHHRWECPIGAQLRATGVMSQLALRAALKAGLKGIQAAREPIAEDGPVRPSNDSEPGDSYRGVHRLLPHLTGHAPGLRFLHAVTAATLYLRLGGAGPPPACWDLGEAAPANSQSEEDVVDDGCGWSPELRLLGSVVLRHLLQLRCNGQAVSELHDRGVSESAVQSNREIRIATAIYPTLSVLNHSCRPNTSLAFHTGATPGDRDPPGTATTTRVHLTVRAARDIAAGQELLHCYGPHSSTMETRERQRLLQEQYYFLCECEACGSQEQEDREGRSQGADAGGRPHRSGLQCGGCQGPLEEQVGSGFLCLRSSCRWSISFSEVKRRLQEIRGRLDEAVEVLETDRPAEALSLLQSTASGLILSETHPLQGEMTDTTARAHASMGNWKSAASQLERSVVATGSQYGEDSVELGRQLFKLAQLHFNGCAPGPTLAVIPRARRLLSLHCGPHCPELQELQAMEDCLRG